MLFSQIEARRDGKKSENRVNMKSHQHKHIEREKKRKKRESREKTLSTQIAITHEKYDVLAFSF